jgi:hypothetical protein
MRVTLLPPFPIDAGAARGEPDILQNTMALTEPVA